MSDASFSLFSIGWIERLAMAECTLYMAEPAARFRQLLKAF